MPRTNIRWQAVRDLGLVDRAQRRVAFQAQGEGSRAAAQVEALEDTHIDPSSLAPFGSFSLQQLKGQIGQGEKFHSEDVQAKTRFGDYRVHGGVMTAISAKIRRCKVH